jgi:dynactin 6
MCTVQENEVLPDYTVIYGIDLRRLDQSDVDDLKLKMVRRQVEVLKKLVPSNLAKFQ